MSITASLSSALSGLTAASRAAEVVSSNVANALTQGYGRRELDLAARRVGSSGEGVTVLGVTRNVSQGLLSDRRVADFGAANRQLHQVFLARMETALGGPESDGSLPSRIATLDASLVMAASRPESQSRLLAVNDAARALAGTISGVATDIQSARTEADRRIWAEVKQLNTTLKDIEALNTEIRSQMASGRDTSALFDSRQRLVDGIASIVPIREISRDLGQIALFTTGGAVLLDGRPAEIGFLPSGLITADMSLSGGALSGLTLNGQPVSTSDSAGLISGGSLSANFFVRDTLAPRAQSQMDAVARDLVERFQSTAVDPSLAPGDAGLFTDFGSAFLPINEMGISQRLRVNVGVDPGQGGEVWKIRDGIGAITPGPPGQSGLLSALQFALTNQRATASGSFASTARSLSGLASEVASEFSGARLAADGEVSFANSRADTLRVLELEQGVDTDREMQMLLQIERAYSANARVVQTVDSMIKTLLEM